MAIKLVGGGTQTELYCGSDGRPKVKLPGGTIRDIAYTADIPTIPSIPSKTSQLTNDGADGTDPFATSSQIPTQIKVKVKVNLDETWNPTASAEHRFYIPAGGNIPVDGLCQVKFEHPQESSGPFVTLSMFVLQPFYGEGFTLSASASSAVSDYRVLKYPVNATFGDMVYVEYRRGTTGGGKCRVVAQHLQLENIIVDNS